jgi:hypothetical protein
MLDECLLTHEEWRAGLAAWSAAADPFPRQAIDQELESAGA